MPLITLGDCRDIRAKLPLLAKPLLSRLSKGDKAAQAKWNVGPCGSAWWDVPHILAHHNRLISGSAEVDYIQHLGCDFWAGETGLTVVSPGCGLALTEQLIVKLPMVHKVMGYEWANDTANRARADAQARGLDDRLVIIPDAFQPSGLSFEFHALHFKQSLHHFPNPDTFLESCHESMQPGGYLVVHEYVGPNRIQMSRARVKAMQRLLVEIPAKNRVLNNGAIKKKINAPGLLRMYISDPSEAPHSSQIVAAIRNYFKPLQEVPLFGNLYHILLKDIAHNFAATTPSEALLLDFILKEDERFAQEEGISDYWFGVYQK